MMSSYDVIDCFTVSFVLIQYRTGVLGVTGIDSRAQQGAGALAITAPLRDHPAQWDIVLFILVVQVETWIDD